MALATNGLLGDCWFGTSVVCLVPGRKQTAEKVGDVLAVVNNGTSFLEDLRETLEQLEIGYDLISGSGQLSLEAMNSYAGAILTGGRIHVYEPDHVDEIALNIQFITTGAMPLLGICLGHQLIAHHFGATVEPLPRPIDEVAIIELVDPGDPLFVGLPGHILARMAHGDAVTALSSSLMRLARSPVGEYEAIRHVSRPVYGLQFHPEAHSKVGLTILGNFATLCRERFRSDRMPVEAEG